MDTSVLSFVLTISGSIIFLLVTIVGYFIKKLISKVDDLSIAMVNISLNFEKQSGTREGFENMCERTHSDLNHLLDMHDRKINDHERRLVKLEK